MIPDEAIRILANEAMRACILAAAEIRKLGPDAKADDEDLDFELWTDEVVGYGSRATRWSDTTHDVDFAGIEDVAPLRETCVWAWALKHAEAAPQVLAATLVAEALQVEILAGTRLGE